MDFLNGFGPADLHHLVLAPCGVRSPRFSPCGILDTALVLCGCVGSRGDVPKLPHFRPTTARGLWPAVSGSPWTRSRTPSPMVCALAWAPSPGPYKGLQFGGVRLLFGEVPRRHPHDVLVPEIRDSSCGAGIVTVMPFLLTLRNSAPLPHTLPTTRTHTPHSSLTST